MPENRRLFVTCDGACRKGVGAYGFMVQEEGHFSRLCAGSGALPEEPTTNQRAELYAAIMALECVAEDFPERAVTLVSDSAYLINCFKERWFIRWLENDWQTPDGPVKNRDLWERLFAVVGALNGRREPVNLVLQTIEWEHVRGHQGHPANEECDAAATRTIDVIFQMRDMMQT